MDELHRVSCAKPSAECHRELAVAWAELGDSTDDVMVIEREDGSDWEEVIGIISPQ